MIEIARPPQPLVKVELTLSHEGHIHCHVTGGAGDKFWLMGLLHQALLGLAAQPAMPGVQPPPVDLRAVR